MSVLIIAPAEDDHAIAVREHLDAGGSEVAVIDTGLFPEALQVAMRFSCCTDRRDFRLSVQGKQIDLSRVGSVWWRRPRPATISEQMYRSSHRHFAANEAYEALAGLWEAMDAQWINVPGNDLAAQHKPYQLRMAQKVGLKIPATLMTNDPDQARQFVDAQGYRNVVYKSFSSTEMEWRETRLLQEEEIALLDYVRHAPVIFQHYVPAKYDLRVTLIDHQIFAAAIHSQQTQYPIDSRIDIANAAIEAVTLPQDISSRLLRLTEALGLRYGAIDLRLTPSGDYVFFEINPAGQCLYIEQATGQPIARALADALARRDEPVTPGRKPERACDC